MMRLDANDHAVCRPTAMPVLTASALREAGREVSPCFALELDDGERVEVEQVLRVLPGRRVVGRARWRGQAVLAKLFIGAGDADNRRAADAEATGLCALQAAGVATPAVLGAGGFASSGHALLLEFLDATCSLSEIWSDAPEAHAAMRAHVSSVFAALGRLHRAGYGHADLHLGNVLLGHGQTYLIDGDAVQPFPADGLERAAAQLANLALWCVQLPVWTVPFWDEGLAAYAAAGASRPEAPRLDAAVRSARAKRLRHFLGKTGRECTQFALERRFDRVVVYVRRVRDGLAEVLRMPDVWLASGAMLKDGGTCTVVRVQAGELDCVVKRYNLKNLRHAVSRLWRPSRAWHSWRAGHLLRHLGIATPEPLAVVEERFGPLRRRAFLVTQHCPGRALLEHLEASREPAADEAAALLEFFRALHGMRIEHGDFKATNLLWHAGRVWVIDLDALQMPASTKTYARAWRRDRRRFLVNWPEGSPLRHWLEANLPAAG